MHATGPTSPDESHHNGQAQFYLRLSWIILSGILALILVGVKNQLNDFYNDSANLRKDLEINQISQSRQIILIVEDTARAMQWPVVQVELDDLANNNAQNHLRLVDLNGITLAESHNNPFVSPDTAPPRFPSIDQPLVTWVIPEKILRVTIPLRDAHGSPSAYLINDSDQSDRFAMLFQARNSQTIHFVVVTILVLGIFFLICWLLFIRPLNQIFHLSRAVTQGTRRVELPPSPVLELQRINQAFNEMVGHLADQQDTQELLNRNLENTVAERTSALEESNAEIRSHNAAMHELIDQSVWLNRNVALNEVIGTIGSGAMILSNADRVLILTKRPQGGFVSAWSKNLPPELIQAMQDSPVREALDEYVLAHQQPLLIKDFNRYTEDFPGVPILAGIGICAFGFWQLTYENELKAVVCCFYDQPTIWKEDDLGIIETFFRQASAVMENARLYEAERTQRQMAEALRDISAALNSTLDLDEVLEGILQNLGRVVPHDICCIMLIEDGEIFPVRWHGIPESSLAEFKQWRYPIQALSNRQIMVETGQATVIPDNTHNPGWVRTRGLEWVKSYAGAPISQRGEVIGFIDLMSSTPNFFTPEVGQILQAFANQAAIALENAKLYQSTQQRMAETTALYRAVQPLFQTTENVIALSRQIAESVTQEFASAHCSILMVNENRTHLVLVAQSGSLHLKEPALPLDGLGLTVKAVRTGRAVYSPDVWKDPAYVVGADLSRSELAIPLRAGEQVIGVMNMESPLVDAFDKRGRRLLASFAEQAALGLENARLFATVRENSEQMARLSEIAQRRAQEAHTLRMATAALSSSLNLQSVLDTILSHLEKVVPHDNACIFLIEDEHHMRVWAVKGKEGLKEVLYQRFPRSDALLQEIERAMDPVILSDAQADPRFHAWGGTTYVHAWMGLPLVAGNKLVGVLTIDRSKYDAFQPEETRLAQAFANQAAVAVQNARLFQSEQQRARELEALHTATTSLVTTLDLQTLLERILDSASSAIPAAQSAALHMLNDQHQLALSVQRGFNNMQPGDLAWTSKTGPWHWVIQQQKPLMIGGNHGAHTGSLPGGEGTTETAEAFTDSWKNHSIMVAPLLLEDTPLGTISLMSAEPEAFSAEELRLLISFASTATVAIHNAQLHSAVQYLAITDPLTNALNRRGFFGLANSLVDQALQFNRPLNAVMIDIDFFKRINDTYGHDAGDVVLKEVANRCRNVLRESDLVCRFGGEEFTILLVESDRQGARGAANRLFHSITDTPVETASGPVRVTISVGVASLGGECNSIDKLLKRADQALYLAKEAGRNQVHAWIEPN